jgi:hypothetical protein
MAFIRNARTYASVTFVFIKYLRRLTSVLVGFRILGIRQVVEESYLQHFNVFSLDE